MGIKIVKDVRKANAVTHGGVLHADEVLATSILSKVIPDLAVARVLKLPALTHNAIVYDIGEGEFDHHQRGGNGSRGNGVPYASAGLIWKAYGPSVCEGDMDVWEYVDHTLVQPVDANDNGVMPMTKYTAQPMGIAQVISGFNPLWNVDKRPDGNGLLPSDHAFLNAVAFMGIILNNVIGYAKSKALAKADVNRAISESSDGVMVLDQYLPWKEPLMNSTQQKAASVRVTVYPDARNGYAWCVVPNRMLAPVAWRGLNDSTLADVTGVKTATFVHIAGFMGGARTLEDAVAMAKQVANQG